MRRLLIAAAALLPLLSQAAWAQRNCLEVGQISSWKVLNDKTLVVEDNFRQKFKLKLIGFCSNLNYHERLAFRSIGGLDISCLQPGDQVIDHSFGTGREVCSITKISPYTREMEQADKAAAADASQERHGY